MNDIYHTNGLEGFWGLLKRGLLGIYHQTSRKNLLRYCKEFEFRYNNRKNALSEQFDKLLGQFCGARLMFKDL